MIGKNISIKNYYWMLAYAFRCLKKETETKIKSESFDNIYELFAFIIILEIQNQIKRGLNRNYNLYEDESSSIRGKIKINETIKKLSFINRKCVIEYDEFSINSQLNQIVKVAIKYLLKSNKLDNKKDYNKKLKILLKYFDKVYDVLPSQIRWHTIRYDRNNKSYRMLISVSYYILNGLLSTNETGKQVFNDYIDDQETYKLYERFIYNYYKFHYGNRYEITSQKVINWISDIKEMLPIMKCDVMIYNKNKEKKLIIDAKYYSSELQENYYKKKFISNNLYQIFSYVKNEDIKKDGSVSGMLLYAKTDDNNIIDNIYNMDGNKIKICNLDLSQEFKDVTIRLNSFIDWFKDL